MGQAGEGRSGKAVRAAMTGTSRLVFVYNADVGVVAMLIDAVHKIASPATYPCSLCAVTYGPVAMKRRWRDFLKTLPLPADFYHRQDFHAAYPDSVHWPLPLVGLARAGRLSILLDAGALDAIPDLDTLIAILRERLRDQQVE
jgi:hypothetical protein